MATIGRRELVLLLLGCDAAGGAGDQVRGITRLQKLLFLLEREGHIRPAGDGFEFTPYKAGPYSSQLYDDLELLENLHLVESKPVGESTEYETPDIEVLDFGHLMGDADSEEAASDAYEEREFAVTPKGREKIERLLKSGDYTPVVDGIRKIKSRFGSHSLSDLLYYVYTKYPEMTTESEIREKVLRRW